MDNHQIRAALEAPGKRRSEAGAYSIGQDDWPGLAKLIEECGEVIQVAAKLISTGGSPEHYSGVDLLDAFVEELGDLYAALWFVQEFNPQVDVEAIGERSILKRQLFEVWHHVERAA